jgi:ABC-type sugar transport system ATPase subunit
MSSKDINLSKSDNEQTKPYIDLKGITHNYGSIRALDDVDFRIYPHEIIGLVGDNGAGKSTLIKIISGVLPLKNGKIFHEDTEIKFESSRDAIEFGIETIYQDMNLINVMDVMRNIFCGREETSRF